MMPVTFKEPPNSRRTRYGASGGGITILLNGKGSDDEVEIFAAILAIALGQPGGAAWDGFIRKDIEIQLLGGGRSNVTVEYGVAGLGGGDTATGVTPPGVPSVPGGGAATDPGAALGPGYSFDLSGETEHITQSLKVVSSGIVGGGGAAPDVKNAIGLQGDSVEGCDRLRGTMTWSRAVVFPYVTMNHIKTWRSICVRKKNDDVFYGQAAGEVLLLRVSGQSGEGTKYNVTFQFGTRENLSDFYLVGDPDAPDPPNDLVVVAAAGWDFVDVKYKKGIVDGAVAPTPTAFYVHQIYGDDDYSKLGIGT